MSFFKFNFNLFTLHDPQMLYDQKIPKSNSHSRCILYTLAFCVVQKYPRDQGVRKSPGVFHYSMKHSGLNFRKFPVVNGTASNPAFTGKMITFRVYIQIF